MMTKPSFSSLVSLVSNKPRISFATAIICLSFLTMTLYIPTAQAAVTFNPNGPPYDNCAKEDYYADLLAQNPDPSQWSKQDVIDLITSSHRGVLPASPAADNGLITALKALWPGDRADVEIRVLYRGDLPNLRVPAALANTDLGWKRHHVWPKYRGWGDDDLEPLTDIYGKAPADATVLERKQKLWFGRCGTVRNLEYCTTPATVETSNTTQQDGKIFAPPDLHKGDVARMLFYFEWRYQATLGLRLVDCPPFNTTDFGYLSELLQWHAQDNVSAEEVYRNDEGCRNWQGNRNPFVDYPQLVHVFYPQGPDEVLPNGALQYSQCTAPTPSPTAAPNPCDTLLQAGDIPMFLVNSDDPDQVVFLPTVDLEPELGSLFLTDNAWDGSKFLTTEGTYEFEIPADGLLAGTVFGFGGNSPFASNWDIYPPGGQLFDIQTQYGDNLFLYCLDSDNEPNIITGWTNTGTWNHPGLTAQDYGTNTSALPPALETAGSIALPHFDNCIYAGPLQRDNGGGTITQERLRELLITPANWDCQDGPRIILNLAAESAGATIMTMGARMTTWTIISIMTTLVFVGG